MRVLREGMQGEDVTAWGNFLLGQGFFRGQVPSDFTETMTLSTKAFQVRSGAKSDGIVGMDTYRAAMYMGFDPTDKEGDAYHDINWPPAPVDLHPVMSLGARQKMFGTFTFKPTPTELNPESIRIDPAWESKNIITVACPQLVSLIPPTGKVRIHRLVGPVFLELWRQWETEGLLAHVLMWGGAYAQRFVRGSTTNLSNHAFGSAFDINVPWNKLGARPVSAGEKGSVRELVQIANKLGWYWGGHYKNRADGMHFELCQLPKP